jgi:hypothetical protein
MGAFCLRNVWRVNQRLQLLGRLSIPGANRVEDLGHLFGRRFHASSPGHSYSMLMISNFLSDLQTAGLRSTNTIVGAGCGTDQNDFTNFLTGFTNLAGLDLLDIHVYQINHFTVSGVDNLQRIIQMADAAHATNAIHPNEMRVGIGEYWRSRRPTRNSARPNAGLRPILDQYEDLGPDRSAVTEYQSGTGLSGAGGWSANSHCPWLLRIHSTRSSCAADNEQRT